MSDWSRSTLYTAVGLIGVGFVLIGLAWNGAAGKDYVAGQLPYLISGGAAGLALICCGLTIVVVQSNRRDNLQLLRRLDEIARAEGVPELQDDAPALAALPADGSVVLAGRRTFHRVGCRLTEGGRDFQAISYDAAIERKLDPCRICKPDDLSATSA